MKMNCEICNDDGKCRNNKNSPNYDEFYSDIYDCCDYVDKDWMVDWITTLKNEEKTEYVSDFVKWSRNV